jgi:ribose transport system substrate-binding protein
MYSGLKAFLSGAVFLVLLIQGCTQKEKADHDEIIETDTTVVIAFISGGEDTRQDRLIKAGAVKAAGELGGIEFLWQGSATGGDIGSQKAAVRELDTGKVKGIIIDPVDNVALVNPVRQMEQAGIPVVIVDSDLEGDDYTGCIIPDDSGAGVAAAREMGRITAGKGNLIVLRYLKDDPVTMTREAVFLQTVRDEFPGISVISEDQYGGPTRKSALTQAENLLIMFPQVDAVYCSHETVTAGMLNALRDIDRAGKVTFVSGGVDDVLVMALGEGEVHALIAHNYLQAGYLALMTVMKAMREEQVESSATIKPEVITRVNIHDPHIQAVLNPPLDAGI